MFRVRTITVSATGREIVRELPVVGEALTIGRAPENDVSIADLAARPHHARVVPAGAGVAIEADGGVAIDGKRTERAETALDAPVTITIGDHTIVLAREGDAVVATVSRAEAPAVDERRAFSLAHRAPGKRAAAWVLVATVAALFLAWPIWSFFNPKLAAGGSADASWSPGKLSRAHANLEQNCKACHVDAFVAVKDQSCASCHRQVHDHANPKLLMTAMGEPGGFAGFKRAVSTAFGRPAGRCVDCHQEHLGPVEMAATEQRFCTDCHADLDARVPQSTLGDAGDFAASHPQFKPVVATAAGFRRIDFDAKPREDSGLKFPHAVHLSTTGGVARMQQSLGKSQPACRDCHVPDADRVGFQPVSMEASCEGCHSLAYDRVGGTVRTLKHGSVNQAIADLTASRGSRGTALRILFAPGGACVDCHVVRPPDGAGGWRIAPVAETTRYLTKGWFDHAAHTTTDCATCHKAKGSRTSADLLMPGIATCRQCHAGEEAAPRKVASSCVMCHSYHPVEGAPPGQPHPSRPSATAAPLRVAWNR